jgi:hypothetical protein
MNARNLLIGIGIVAVVTGGVLGSGALTQVTAERTATVSTSGDASAAIGLEVVDNPSNVVTGSSTNEGLELSFENINKNATTTVSAINVTNRVGETVDLQVNVESSNWLSLSSLGTNQLNDNSSTEVVFVVETDDSTSYNDATINVTATTT